MYVAAVRNLEWVKKCKQFIGINLECPRVRMPRLKLGMTQYSYAKISCVYYFKMQGKPNEHDPRYST